MKKIVLFGGGTTSSQILKGLKQFPVEITSIIGVADSGRSTGDLRREFDIPAVGDISKVMLSMSDADDDILNLMKYKFKKESSLNGHSIKNLIITALLDMYGSFDKAVPVFGKLINTKGTVLPLTEESINLIAETTEGETIFGEDDITEAMKTIKSIRFDKEFTTNPKIFKEIESADLIVLSAGSLYTSIIPHLMAPGVAEALKNSGKPIIYICNLITQPGETENLTASGHVKLIEEYLGKGILEGVIVNSDEISEEDSIRYESREQKLPVIFDKDELKKLNIKIIADKLHTIEDELIRHDALKTGFLIFSYLMDGEK